MTQGTVASTADGTPLQGQLTTDVRAFDSGEGQSAMPDAAKANEGESQKPLAGAVYFKVSDQNGNVASNFTAVL